MPASAIAPKKSPSGNIAAKYFAARSRAAVRAVDAVAQPVTRPLLQPVGPDDRGAADRLGELGDHVADARPFLVVGRAAGDAGRRGTAEDREVRDERDERQLPRVDEHHDEGADDQRADEPRDHPPLHEAGEGLDVARHPRRTAAASGRCVRPCSAGGCGRTRRPAGCTACLGGPDQPEVGGPAEDHDHEHDHQGDQAGAGDEPGLEPLAR